MFSFLAFFCGGVGEWKLFVFGYFFHYHLEILDVKRKEKKKSTYDEYRNIMCRLFVFGERWCNNDDIIDMVIVICMLPFLKFPFLALF